MPVSELESAEAQAAAAGGEPKRAYVQRIFSQIAPRYDLLNHLLSFNIDKAWRRHAIAALDWERAPRGTYLDLCAGTLDVATQLSRASGVCRPDRRGRLRRADAARRSRQGAGVRSLRPSSPTRSTYRCPTTARRARSSAFGIRNVADLDAALREMHRVLEPGARFVILEFTTPRSRARSRRVSPLLPSRSLPRIGALVSGHRTAYAYLPRSVAQLSDRRTDLAARMRAAASPTSSGDTLTFGVAAIHSGTKR